MREIILTGFSGFYNSDHSENLDHEFRTDVEYLQQRSEEAAAHDGLEDDLSSLISWEDVYRSYAAKYAEVFMDILKEILPENQRMGLRWEFLRLSSPREYNFETDHIHLKISLGTLNYMYKAVDKKGVLQGVLKETFTSGPGFISYYSNNLEDWEDKVDDDGGVAAWDSVMLSYLLTAYVRDRLGSIDINEPRWCKLRNCLNSPCMFDDDRFEHGEAEKAVDRDIARGLYERGLQEHLWDGMGDEAVNLYNKYDDGN